MSDFHSYAGPTQDPVEAQKDRILEIIRSEAALSESSEVGLFAGQVMQKIRERQ